MRLLKRSEKIWLRIGSDDSWSAYKQIRKQYQDKLMEKSRGKISMKIEKCGSNSKNCFLLVNHLIGQKPEITTRNSDKELADDLANFFLSKRVKIREELDDQPLYQPSKSDAPEFNGFRKLEED